MIDALINEVITTNINPTNTTITNLYAIYSYEVGGKTIEAWFDRRTTKTKWRISSP